MADETIMNKSRFHRLFYQVAPIVALLLLVHHLPAQTTRPGSAARITLS